MTTKQTKNKNFSYPVLVEGKYGIILSDANNWVVGKLKDGVTSHVDVRSKDFDPNTYTYHATIEQAVIWISKCLVKDRVMSESERRIIGLYGLIAIIRDSDQWMRDALHGKVRA